jgi:hypothetical protein
MSEPNIPFFGARQFAREQFAKNQELLRQIADLKARMAKLGHLTIADLEAKKMALRIDIDRILQERIERQRLVDESLASAMAKLAELKQEIVETEEVSLLQEVGVYRYRHPIDSAVAYQQRLAGISQRIKDFMKREGSAACGATDWTVNGSIAQGRRMVSETSKLMLRAFNAEADSAVRSLKPYKLDASIERLRKAAATIERLGKTMSIGIAKAYLDLRIEELELTSDFLHKEAEEKEAEREERSRLREERKAQQEMERERARLEKEQQHYANALAALEAKGDEGAAARVREQLADVRRAIDDVDYRAANIRAGYVYVISNIGSFGDRMVKVGMTRRLDPMDRVRELSDASVPFNFDVHALFFSADAVGIETAMHQRLAVKRVNRVNLRREFFRVTPSEAKAHLAELAGELLQFTDTPEAGEYRESQAHCVSDIKAKQETLKGLRDELVSLKK